MQKATHKIAAFTLIELSIVLVIIGLIVGGVLVGQDLIKAAQVRAQITQIEKYQTATNTFYGKYGALPGDLNEQVALQFGFMQRGPYGPQGSGSCLPACGGQGDGNGIIEGQWDAALGQGLGWIIFGGETATFWVDLSQVGMIDGTFNTANINNTPASASAAQVKLYMPEAKIGGGNFVYVHSANETWDGASWQNSGINYFSLSTVVGNNECCIYSDVGLTVGQAFGIDTKLDDGLPQSGRVTAQFVSGNACCGGVTNNQVFFWAIGGIGATAFGWGMGGAMPGTPAPPGPLTCYDNGNNANNPMLYSVEVNSGAGVNCALSFRFQ